LRKEGLGVYYSSHDFNIWVTNFKLGPQPNHWVWEYQHRKPFVNTYCFGWTPKAFGNLLEWLELYHAGVTVARPRENKGHPTPQDLNILHLTEAVFDLVDTLKDDEWGPKVVEALYSIAHVLAGIDLYIDTYHV